MKTKAILAALLVSAAFVACDKDDAGDTTKPVINLISPAEGEAIAADGEGMHFEMELSDNVALASYKVEIHNNFDGHDHSTSDSKADDETSDETVDFTYNNTWDDIAGQLNATIHHHEIVIPTNATHGDYHFMVYCVDAAGNESYVVANVVIGEDSDHDHDEE